MDKQSRKRTDQFEYATQQEIDELMAKFDAKRERQMEQLRKVINASLYGVPEEEKRVKLSTSQPLPGKLLWTYAKNKKIFCSHKRFDGKDSLREYACIGHQSGLFSEVPDSVQELLLQEKVYGIVEKDGYVRLFGSWEDLHQYGDRYIAHLEQEEEQERKERLELQEKQRKEYQERLRLEEEEKWEERKRAIRLHEKKYSGLKRLFAPKFRETHCYSCLRKLYSSSHSECPTCKWLTCNCGACGCSYMGTGTLSRK